MLLEHRTHLVFNVWPTLLTNLLTIDRNILLIDNTIGQKKKIRQIMAGVGSLKATDSQSAQLQHRAEHTQALHTTVSFSVLVQFSGSCQTVLLSVASGSAQ